MEYRLLVELLEGFLAPLRDAPFMLRILIVFCVSLLPGVGGPATTIAIVGHGILGLPVPVVTVVCIIGNIIPVPFIILFIRAIFNWLRKISDRFGRLVDRLEEKANLRGERLKKGVFVGLTLYVAVPLPLPGMGAWTAALLAAVLNVELKVAFPAIAIGVVISGTIVALGVMGISALMM